MKTRLNISGLAALTMIWAAAPAATAADTVAPTTGDGIIQLSELAGTENITCLDGEHVCLNKSTNGNPLTIEGTVYESGIGTHAPSVCIVELNGATSFHTVIGVDDEADDKEDHGIIGYTVTAYGATLADATQICTGELDRRGGTRKHVLDIPDLSSYRYIRLEFTQNGVAWADHGDWADARFTYDGTRPAIIPESYMYSAGDKIVRLPEEPTIEGARIVPLSTLDLGLITNGWGTVRANRSIDNNPLTMKGRHYVSGIGVHATARIVVKLNGSTPKFHASLGIDDEVKAEAEGHEGVSDVAYKVILRSIGGGEKIAASGKINVADAEAVDIDLDGLTAYKYLVIELDNDGSDICDHVDLGNAYFEFLYQNSTEPEIVHESALLASLDAATVLFSQPGVRFMHKLKAQNPESTISVRNLPAGLYYNARRNLIEGIIDTEGEYSYTVDVTLDGETTPVPISLTVSSGLQQPTPFMGWLSWNSIESAISGDVIKTVADAMESQGLIDAGYNYLVIDDCWHAPARDAAGNPVEHPSKFPEGMKASADYVHSKNLRFGIYSDAAEHTCAGEYGSYGYEAIDARKYAEWDVDLLKYDYCGAPADAATAKARYTAMGNALKASGRDILFYICEWGVREPWKWGTEAGGTCWRATYDTRDCWMGKNGGIGIIQSIDGMKDIWHYNGVNRWNDADMMCVGLNGTGKSSNDPTLCQTGPGMTKDEYRTQFALWCMWSSPLTLSFDLTQPISDEDRAIMTNPELIALDQDRMGQAAETVSHIPGDCLILAKDCENGDVAISVTNLGATARAFTVDLADIAAIENPSAPFFCRDAVNRKDCPKVSSTLDCGTIPSHATVVFRLSPEQSAIDDIAAGALDNIVVTAAGGNSVGISMAGAGATGKRLLLCDLYGRVVDNASGTSDHFSLQAPGHGVYILNIVCAARSMSVKVAV